jgi:hypothetical protein
VLLVFEIRWIFEMGMKRSTIRLVIRKKLKHWLASITDENVRKAAEAGVIVTGGCITSMLLDEPINDYDLYFRDLETAKAVAAYYVGVFNANQALKTAGSIPSCQPSLKVETRKNIRGEEEDRVIVYMKSSGVASEGQEEYAYFENRPASATDDFMASLDGKDLGEDVVHEFDSNDPIDVATSMKDKSGVKGGMYRPVFMSENAITLSEKIQLVVRFYGEPAAIHDNYDFIHCQCYYDYRKDVLELPAAALESILSKSLVYNGSLYPIASIFRTRKFIERGWRITAGQMLKMVFQLQGVNLNDPAVLREQLIGVDQAYMHQLLRAIETSTQKIDATYIAQLIDKVFE